MRVLFATYPEKTIFQYFAPLAWALRTAGHEVRVASQPGFAEVITQAGLTAVPVGSDRDIWRLAEHRPQEREAGRVGIPAPYDTATAPERASWEYLLAGYRSQVGWWLKMKNVPMITDLVAMAGHWKPDLVIWEPTSYAGPIAARACGAAHARLLYSLDVFGLARDHFLRRYREQPPQQRTDPLADWLSANLRQAGAERPEFTEELATGHFTIDQFPASLQQQADLHYVPVRYVPYGGPAVVPKWLQQPPERPRVALTLGLSATERFSGYVVGVQDILDSLADLDIEVVATIAESEQRKLRHIPANARVVAYAPLHALVPTCSAVIHHAGAATLATTSLHAVPQLALPFHFDQEPLADRLAAQGAGLALHANQATGQSVRAHLVRLLEEPAFRAGAVRLRDEMAAMPSPNQLVDHLEELTVKYRGP